MKFSVALAPLSLALLAQAVVGQSSSSSAAAASSASTTAASSTSASSSSSSSSASSGGSGGASQGASTPVATCTLVSGDPTAQPFGCVDGATTSTPPYDSASLQSFLIGGYSAGKEGTAYSEVASQLADSVTKIYPTLTVSYSDIVNQYVTALEASATNYHKDAAVVSAHSSSLGAIAVVAAGIIAGGAFIL